MLRVSYGPTPCDTIPQILVGEVAGIERVQSGKKPKGRHPHERLTAVRVKGLKAPGKYADGNGLYLVVDDSGAKRWQLRTVIKGRRSELGLGSVRLVSLADARAEAVRLRRLARTGGDPLAERRQAKREVPTFKVAAQMVHAAHGKTFRNAKHKAQWLASLEANVFPAIGDRLVNTIDTADVLRVLSPIWTTKPETARRIKQRIRVVLDWAKASGHRNGDSPVDGITKVLPKHSTRQTHHAALAYAEVPDFIQKLRASDAHTATKLAFEYAILTAARTSEVLGARWTEIDKAAKTWRIPASRIKAGREHVVPLSTVCLELLDRAAELTDGSGYVFPSRRAGKPLSNMVFLKLLERMGRDDTTAHGFRSAFRDWAAERTSFSRAVCEAALAHVVKDKVEAAYLRTSFPEQRRSLMATWATYATSKPADVVSLRAQA